MPRACLPYIVLSFRQDVENVRQSEEAACPEGKRNIASDDDTDNQASDRARPS